MTFITCLRGFGPVPGVYNGPVKEEIVTDMVHHPQHYQGHPKGIECIDVVEDFPAPNLANVVKYVWRVAFGGKWDDIEDLEKARWYIDREISRRTVRE